METVAKPSLALLLLGLLACDAGGPAALAPAVGQDPSAPEEAGTAPPPVTLPPAAGPGSAEGIDWQDPEPEEAQALAEAVLEAEWNRDKKSRLAAETTRLRMRITSLEYHTSALAGFRSGVGFEESTLEDRLDRLGAEVTETEVTIRLASSVLFDFDRSDIRPDAERALFEVVEVLNAYGKRPVRVEGHTDSIGTEAYNRGLSLARAGSVCDWLKAHSVASGRLVTDGFGESRPVADNDTAAGRQQNRRVEVVVER